METKKLTIEEIDANMKRMKESMMIAKLDNHTSFDSDYLEIIENW